MKYTDFSKLFFGLLILHLAVIYKPESMALYYISKPALVFSLLSFFWHKSNFMGQALRRIIAMALLLSLSGDVLLMFEGEALFLVGMAAFALAHIFYIGFYLSRRLPLQLTSFLPSLIVPLLGIFSLYWFVDTPESLELFLYIYAVIIGLHFLMSTRYYRRDIASSLWPILGAMLFILSDFILAINLFNSEHVLLKMGVMLTYALAQYAIVIGVLKTDQAIAEKEKDSAE